MGARGPKPGFKRARAAAAAAAKKGAATPLSSISATPIDDVAAARAADLPAAVIAPVESAPAAVAAPHAPRKARDPFAGLSAADRENPARLSGEALRILAHRRGMSRSELGDTKTDDKIREQLRYITHRQYDSAEA